MALSPFIAHLPAPNFAPPRKQQAMEILRALLEEEKLTPVIDRSFPLGEASLALRRLESGDAIGRIVITP